jgi:hypothetical protein
MIRDDYKIQVQRLTAVMKEADLRLALLASIDLAELALEHPKYWVDHRPKADVSTIRRALKEAITNSEKLLGIDEHRSRHGDDASRSS